jgi:hypothetical protein
VVRGCCVWLLLVVCGLAHCACCACYGLRPVALPAVCCQQPSTCMHRKVAISSLMLAIPAQTRCQTHAEQARAGNPGLHNGHPASTRPLQSILQQGVLPRQVRLVLDNACPSHSTHASTICQGQGQSQHWQCIASCNVVSLHCNSCLHATWAAQCKQDLLMLLLYSYSLSLRAPACLRAPAWLSGAVTHETLQQFKCMPLPHMHLVLHGWRRVACHAACAVPATCCGVCMLRAVQVGPCAGGCAGLQRCAEA